MGLDIYNLSDKTILIASLESIDSISIGLKELEMKTGQTIDEYGTTRIYLEQLVLLDKFTDEKSEWKPIFKIAIDSGHGLLIEGD